MFGRLFLFTLSMLSLAWILYVGYDLLDQKDNISPERIFTENDGEILIINRTQEVHVEELDFTFDPSVSKLFAQILKNIYPNEQVYLSEKRPIIIVEIPVIWTQSSIRSYFRTKNIGIRFTEDNNLVIDGKYSGKYKKNYLLISVKGQQTEPVEEKEWPLWDNKASASIVQLINPLKSTNIYFKENGTVSYQTKYGEVRNFTKVDDADLFAQLVPSDIKNYHFYEKKFALSSKLLTSGSPLAQWMEEGFLCFDYEGSPCIISDYNKVQDPVFLLNGNENRSESAEETEHFFRGISLTNDFPSNTQSGFYIDNIADKVVISESKAVLDKIIADYEIGNTLALNQDKMNLIFAKMPKKVSERAISSKQSYTLSSYKNLLIRTQLAATGTVSENKKPLVKEKNNSFGISGTVEEICGNGNTVYVFTSENELLALSNKKQIWKLNYDGKLIGKPKLIDIFENGNQQILFNTKNKVYLLSSAGANVNSFPLECSAENVVSFYRWNGKTNFLLVNTNMDLLQIDQDGRILKKLKLNCGKVNNEVDVYRNGKVLTAIVSGESKTQTVDLERNRNLKSLGLLPWKSIQIKQPNGFHYHELDEQGLQRSDQNGNKTQLFSGKGLRNLKKITRGQQTWLCFQDNKQIYILNDRGTISTHPTSVSQLEDFDVLILSDGTFCYAALDGIENNIYLYDSAGKLISEKAFQGKKMLKLAQESGRIILSTSIQNNVVQYYDLLN